MVEIAEQVRRPRGRPPIRSDEETRHLLIESAGKEFETNGYAGTCMADVAERAGVSTKTVYRLFPNKADLLAQVVSDRIGQFMLEIDADALNALPIAEALERMLVAYGTLTLSRAVRSTASSSAKVANSRRSGRPSMSWRSGVPMRALRLGCVASANADSSCSTIHRRLPECCAA